MEGDNSGTSLNFKPKGTVSTHDKNAILLVHSLQAHLLAAMPLATVLKTEIDT